MTQRKRPPRPPYHVTRAYLALCARCGGVVLCTREELGRVVVCGECAPRQRPLSDTCE